MWWLGTALAGVTVVQDGWPEDVGIPVLTGPCELPLPPPGIAAPIRVELSGELGEDGVFRPLPGSEVPDLSACRFTPVEFMGTPAAVPITLAVEGPTPAIDLVVTARLRGDGGTIPDLPLAIGTQIVRTDDDGRAAFRNVAGEVRVVSGDPRFRIDKDTLDVAEGTATLWVASEEGWELVARYSQALERPGTQVVEREEIALAPGTNGDPIRALANRPGLVRTPFESGWLLVRGGDPGHTGLFLDGVRIPLLYHLGGFTSVIHPEMTGRLQFWPGSTPARYGRHLAGAANIVPRKLGKRRQLVGGANVAFAHAFVEVPTRTGGFAASFRRSYLDAVLTAAVGAQRARIAPRFWDVNARLAGQGYSFTLLGLSDAINAPTGEGTDTVEIRQTAGQLQARFEIPVRELELEISPWAASWRRSVEGLDAQPRAIQEYFPGLRTELRGKHQSFHWVAGAEGEYRTYRVSQGQNTRSAPAQLIDPYVEGRVGGALQLDAGLRLETLFVDDQLPRAELSPRGSLRWKPVDWLVLDTQASRTHRPPNPAYLVGLPDGVYLGLERADALSAGANVRGGPWSLDVRGWVRWMRNLGGFEQDGSLGQLFGRAYGLETQGMLELDDLSVRAVYQYTRSTRWEDPGGQLERNLTPWDQPHRILIVAMGQLPRNWAVSGRLRYSSGFPAPREQTDAYDILADTVTVLNPIQGRLSPYVGLDVKVTHRFLFRTWRLDVYLDLQNVTNTRIFEPIITGFFDDSSPAYSKGLPILPLFGIDGAFWPGRKGDRDDGAMEDRTPSGP